MTPETGNLLGKNIPPVNDIMIHPLLSEKVFVYHPFRDFRVPSADANREFQAPRIGFVLNFDYWNRKKNSEKKIPSFFLPPPFPICVGARNSERSEDSERGPKIFGIGENQEDSPP